MFGIEEEMMCYVALPEKRENFKCVFTSEKLPEDNRYCDLGILHP